MLRDDELVVTLFAGGGGACTGMEQALGRPVDIAVNHSAVAIEMHARNHPRTKHYREDVWRVAPSDACAGRPVAVLWLSPACTHFSRAKGSQNPKSAKIRSLAYAAVRWAREVRPRIIVLENVVEFLDWGPLDSDGLPIRSKKGRSFAIWLGKLKAQGYRVEWRKLVAADYGAPTTRERLFLVARCDNEPIGWPEPTHSEQPSLFQAPWRSAAECIDWSIPCPSIFDRKRPLAEATLRRIAAGVMRYVVRAARPFIVPITHRGGDRVHSVDAPLRTVTTAHRGEFALVSPHFTKFYGSSTAGADPGDPLPTITAGGQHLGLTAATLVQTGYGERAGQRPRALDVEQPLGTVVAGGAKHALVSALLTKHFGGVVGQPITAPASTITARDHHALTTVTLGSGKRTAEVRAFLVKYYGSGKQHQSLREPLHTVTTKARFGLVTVEGVDYEIADIGMRMLAAHELWRAQGFPESLDVEGFTKTQQIELCGNSVCPQVAAAIVRANVLERAQQGAA